MVQKVEVSILLLPYFIPWRADVFMTFQVGWCEAEFSIHLRQLRMACCTEV